MRAGKLRHVGTVEHQVVTGQGDRGQPVQAWQTYANDVPMHVLPMTGKQLEVARQLVAQATHKIQVRDLDGVTAGMRVNLYGRYFVIGWVDEGDFKQHDMTLTCVEQTTGAS